MKLRQIAARNIKRNTRRSILSILAIGLAAMIFVFAFSLIKGLVDDLGNNIKTYSTGEIQIRHKEFDKNEMLNPIHLRIQSYETVLDLLDRDEVTAMSPRIKFPAAIYKNGSNYKAQGMGVDFKLEQEFENLEASLVQGRLPKAGQREVLLAVGLADKMGIDLEDDNIEDDRITFMSQTMRRAATGITLEVTGIIRFPLDALNKGFFMAPLDKIQKFLGMGPSVTEILLMLKKGTDGDKFEKSLAAEFSQNEALTEYQVKYWKNLNTTFSFMGLASTMYDFIGLIFFLLGSTVIINTTMMVIFERTKEIGTISAMGMTGGEIVKLFFLEAFFISLIGSFCGVIIGILMTLPFTFIGIDLSSAMQGISFEINSVMKPVLSIKSTLGVFLYSVAVASLASLLPCRRAAKINPVEALRSV